VNLTKEQLELLTVIADVYTSGHKSSFQLILVHNPGESSLMFLNGGPRILFDGDKEDLMQLASEGFLHITETNGMLRGKITAKGIEAAILAPRSKPAPDSVEPPIPVRLPPPPPGQTNRTPTPVRLTPPPGWEESPAPQVTSEPPPARQAAETLSTPTPKPLDSKPPVVFIGHGKRDDWLRLEKFLTKFGITCVEFNSESAAGMTTQDRLKDMVKQSVFAFLVMTAEDKQSDGTFNARQNVVHEAGLCHGLLGWEKAILLLEEGCTKFSNGDGLTHIPFQAGKITSAFHDVRELLESRGLIAH
jgi:hypothetical protein